MAKRICPDCGEEWDDEDPHYLKAEIARLNRVIAAGDQVIATQNDLIAALQGEIATYRKIKQVVVEGALEQVVDAIKDAGLFEQVREIVMGRPE